MSNLKSVKLIMVAVNTEEDIKKGKAAQNNKYYNMTENPDGTFTVKFGRVDSTEQTKTYPMSKWQSTYNEKTKKGYKDVTHLSMEIAENDDGSTEAPISDSKINTLFVCLQQYANKSIAANYTISSAKVTQAMVDEAQQHVDALVTLLHDSADIAEINKKLISLYHIIPRKMDNVKNFLLPTDQGDLTDSVLLEKANKLIGNEQQTLDVMAGQVVINNNNKSETTEEVVEKRTILDILGIEVTNASNDDIAQIKKLLGPNSHQFKNAYKVLHKQTQNRYDSHLNNADNKKTELFWHGSRNQNWLNIISTGLLIRPAGAIHTGSMFGDGIYFADKAQKSIGYTSLRGSYWSNGSDNTAYLALFSVHVGNQKNIHKHDSSCYRLNKDVLNKEKFDSVFAHGGADLRNNEYIVYDSHQCTISYLVEIG